MPSSINVSRGGVEVHKTLLTDEGPMPMVAYVLESERSDPVVVRLLEQVPAGVERSAIALHDDYGGDDWRVGIDGVEFERELRPGERVRTGFFVECAPATADRFFVAPSIEDVRAAVTTG